MKHKIILFLVVIFIGIFATGYHIASALSVFQPSQGGTGTTTPSGILYGDNGATNHLNTATIGSGLTFSGGTLSATGGGSTYPFTPNTNFGVGVSATSTPIWDTAGIFASSTSQFDNSTTTQATIGNIYLQGSTIKGMGSVVDLLIQPSSGQLDIYNGANYAKLNTNSISGSDKTFTFPNTTGTFCLTVTCITSVTATYPILSTGGNTPVISTAFGTTTTWGIGNNGIVMTGATGIPFTTATTSPSFQLATYASTTQLSSGTNTFYVNGSGTVNTKDVATGYMGITSPVSGLSLQTGTTTGWTASTSNPYIPNAVAPFAGTIKDVKCATDASFLGIEVDINGTAIAPSYFVASTTKGIVTATGSNTFSYGDVISFKAGTTTSATATTISCTIRTVQTS